MISIDVEAQQFASLYPGVTWQDIEPASQRNVYCSFVRNAEQYSPTNPKIANSETSGRGFLVKDEFFHNRTNSILGKDIHCNNYYDVQRKNVDGQQELVVTPCELMTFQQIRSIYPTQCLAHSTEAAWLTSCANGNECCRWCRPHPTVNECVMDDLTQLPEFSIPPAAYEYLPPVTPNSAHTTVAPAPPPVQSSVPSFPLSTTSMAFQEARIDVRNCAYGDEIVIYSSTSATQTDLPVIREIARLYVDETCESTLPPELTNANSPYLFYLISGGAGAVLGVLGSLYRRRRSTRVSVPLQQLTNMMPTSIQLPTSLRPGFQPGPPVERPAIGDRLAFGRGRAERDSRIFDPAGFQPPTQFAKEFANKVQLPSRFVQEFENKVQLPSRLAQELEGQAQRLRGVVPITEGMKSKRMLGAV